MEFDKTAFSITEIARQLGYKVERGMMKCPRPERHTHGDRTPSVSINEEKGFFKCFVCPDIKGDVISLVRLSLGVGFVEAVKWLGGDCHTRDPNCHTRAPSAVVPSTSPSHSREGGNLESLQILQSFFEFLPEIDPHSPVAYYLAKRHIYKNAWDKAHLRYIDDYWRLTRELKNHYSVQELQNAGLFNPQGKMRFGRHPLIIPYLDENGKLQFFQARAIDKSIIPKELNYKGTISFPFNREALDEKEGFLYVCEGAIDTLTLLGKGFSAVGIPGAQSFKKEWVQLFKNKNVVLCLDNDSAGRAGNAKITAMLKEANISVRTFELPLGMDLNEWFLS